MRVCWTLHFFNNQIGFYLWSIWVSQVFVAAILKRKHICPSNPQMLHGSQNSVLDNGIVAPSADSGSLAHTQRFR
jgi:hypothetical protein